MNMLKKKLSTILENNLRKSKIEKIIAMVFCYQTCSVSVRKKCSSDRGKLLKFKAKVREFEKILRSLEQFIQTLKGWNNFGNTECFFNLFLEVSHI